MLRDLFLIQHPYQFYRISIPKIKFVVIPIHTYTIETLTKTNRAEIFTKVEQLSTVTLQRCERISRWYLYPNLERYMRSGPLLADPLLQDQCAYGVRINIWTITITLTKTSCSAKNLFASHFWRWILPAINALRCELRVDTHIDWKTYCRRALG